MKFIKWVFLICLLIPVSSCKKENPETIRIYPEVRNLKLNKGFVEIGNELKLENHGFNDISFLSEYFQDKTKTLSQSSKKNQPTIIHLNFTPGLKPEYEGAYNLQIQSDSLIISANHEKGLFYGIQTLLQLLNRYSKDSQLPLLEITDYPEFSWRGMHLDVSRHFFPVEFIKKYIDILALHKLNVFHWHLVDDQGWRIQIDSYPGLVKKAAWRKDRTDQEWSYEVDFTHADDPEAYGGYYTKDEIREIVAYAEERFITIVPEIEMPGHSQAALTAYPQFSCSGKAWRKPSDIPFEFSDPYCAGNDSVFIFLKDILNEVMELFPSEYIHIGGDEAKKDPWENCPKCQERMRKEKLESSHELQAWFIEQIDDFLRENNRKTIGWNEIMEGNLEKGTAIMAWLGDNIAAEAINKGYSTVSAESNFFYLSKKQQGKDELTLDKVYLHQAISSDLDPGLRDKFLGVNACLWTENTITPEQAQMNLLPRLTAFSETAWSDPGRKDFQSFISSLTDFLTYLDNENILYYIPYPEGLTDDVFYKDIYKLKLQNPLPGTSIRYTLDGTEPELNSKLYSKPVFLNEEVTVKAALFLPNGKRGKLAKARISKTELRESIDPGEVINGVNLFIQNLKISDLDMINENKFGNPVKTENIIIPENLAGTDGFILKYEGFIKISKDGIYTFSTRSDDGSRLYIDNDLLVDNNGVHGPVTISGKKGLKKGYHPFRLLFFEADYGESLEVKMIYPDGSSGSLDNNILFIQKTK